MNRLCFEDEGWLRHTHLVYMTAPEMWLDVHFDEKGWLRYAYTV